MRNLKVKYRGSVLGFLWTLLIPLAQVAVFYFVYKVLLNIQVPNYLAVVVSGVLPWFFFATAVNESFESLVASRSLLTQVPLPLQSIPAAATVTHFANLIFSLPALLLVILFSDVSVSWQVLLFLPLTLILLIFTYSLAFILASLFVIFRDLKQIFTLVIQLWVYVTPVFYTLDVIPEKYRWTVYVNPLSGYFISIRDVLVGGRLPDLNMVAIFVGWTFLLLGIAYFIKESIGARLVERL